MIRNAQAVNTACALILSEHEILLLVIKPQMAYSMPNYIDKDIDMFEHKEPIEKCPIEILHKIFSLLQHVDLINTSKISRFFYSLCSKDDLFNNAFQRPQDMALSEYISRFTYNRRTVALLPSRQIAIGCCNGTIQIWDYQTATIIKSISAYNHSENPEVLCTAHIGSDRILTSAYNKAIRIYNYKTGECLQNIALAHSVKTVTSLGKEEIALGFYNGNIQILNVETCQFVASFSHGSHWVLGLARLSDCELASSSQDGKIRLWNYRDGQQISELTPEKTDSNWAYSVINLGHDKIGTCHDDGFRVWNYRTGLCLRTIALEPRKPDPNILMANQIRDIMNEIKCHTALPLTENLVLCGYGGNVMRIWNHETGVCLQVIKDHRDTVLYTKQALLSRVAEPLCTISDTVSHALS